MDWNIQPLVGIGVLKFGMNREQVADQNLGAITAADPAFDGSLNEYRALDVPVCNYVDGLLASVDTDRRVKNVSFAGLDLYSADSRTVLQTLEKANGGAKIGLGFVLFVNIGVNTGGFYDEEQGLFFDPLSGEQDERGVGVARRGAYDAYLKDYADISFLNR